MAYAAKVCPAYRVERGEILGKVRWSAIKMVNYRSILSGTSEQNSKSKLKFKSDTLPAEIFFAINMPNFEQIYSHFIHKIFVWSGHFGKIENRRIEHINPPYLCARLWEVFWHLSLIPLTVHIDFCSDYEEKGVKWTSVGIVNEHYTHSIYCCLKNK